MFNNSGRKIKLLANVLCWIGIIFYVILAIIMFVIGTNIYDSGTFIGLGFIFLILGPLVSWISSLFIFGFGELVDKSNKIEKNTHITEEKTVTKE